MLLAASYQASPSVAAHSQGVPGSLLKRSTAALQVSPLSVDFRTYVVNAGVSAQPAAAVACSLRPKRYQSCPTTVMWDPASNPYGQPVATLVKKVLESVPQFYNHRHGMKITVPFPVEVEVGHNMLDMKHWKAAA